MSTSGSVNFTQTRNQLINDAFQLIGVYGVGRTISAEDMAFAASMLNKMVKAWQAKGIHLWGLEEAYLFSAKDTAEYQLGGNSGDARAATRAGSILTQLDGALATGSTTLIVDSTVEMAASDIVGVKLDDQTTQWSTILSVDSSTQITIADALTGGAADNSNVYTFTSRINKPLRIQSMRRKLGVDSSSTTIPMMPLSQQEYFDLPSKGISGNPTHYYYNPNISNGRLYVWPAPENTNIHFEFTFNRMLEDFDAAPDNADFPTEWLECITYQLAYRLAPAFGKDKNVVQPEASIMFQDLLSWDSEITGIQFTLDQ